MTRTVLTVAFLAVSGQITGVHASEKIIPARPASQFEMTSNSLAPNSLAQLPVDRKSAIQTVALAADDQLVVREPRVPQVCEPAIVDDRVKLDPGCINRIENLGVRKGRYSAQSRDKRELRSLCANTFLPRCRHKY